MMALMLCLAAAPVLAADPAPVSESLRKALVNVGLELTEEHLYGQQRSEEAPPFMVLMPGLARGCHSTELMRSYLSSCRAGASALTMVFQFGHRTAKSPNDVLDEGACVRSVQAAASGSRCNVVLAAQSFKVVNRPCGDAPLPDRVQMQTIAVGRALAWARHSFSWESDFYIRARNDDLMWCVPDKPPPSGYIAINNIYPRTQRGGLAVSDRYAIVPRTIAHMYFDAWKIWETNVSCTHNCFAGFIGPGTWKIRTDHRNTHPRGEQALSVWLTKFDGQFNVYKIHAGDHLMRALNRTHLKIGFDHLELRPALSYEAAAAKRSEVVRCQAYEPTCDNSACCNATACPCQEGVQ